jgi:TonB family protein
MEWSQVANPTGEAGGHAPDMLWMDAFICVDGLFRYYGGGSGSFLDPVMPPLRVKLADPCSKKGKQQGGLLIHRGEPSYPEQAKTQHVGGTVELPVTVGPDGSVKEVRIVKGSELLEDAARAAVMEWKFEPFIKCGRPIEMKIPEHVQFPTPGSS